MKNSSLLKEFHESIIKTLTNQTPQKTTENIFKISVEIHGQKYFKSMKSIVDGYDALSKIEKILDELP